MKLRCPCCSNEVAPAPDHDIFTFGILPDTPPTSQDFQARNVASTSVGPFQPEETRLDIESHKEQPPTECLSEIRVDKCDDAQPSASFHVRPRNSNSSTAAIVDNGSLPTSFQMLILSWIQPMESKANTKLFGSVKAVRHEQTRHKQAGWIIHPCSAFRLYWNLVMFILLILNMYALPVVITFFNEKLPVSWLAFNILSDVFFLTDLTLNFRTGIMVNNSSYRFILEPKKIVMKYLRTWFLIDLISSLPLDYIIDAFTNRQQVGLVGASRALRVLRLAKLLSLLRLLRVSRLVRYVSQYEVIFNWTKSFMKFINLIAIMTLVTHWNACLQYLVPSFSDFPNNSWVAIHRLQDVTWSVKYIWSAFKALSHMLCIGYGRFPPQNIQEVVLTAFSMVTGATCYSIFIAYCIAAIQQTDSSRRQYHERVQQISEYMSNRKLPTDTRQKVLKYFEHRYKGKFFHETSILGEISWPLRNEIISHNCRDLVSAVPFFSEAGSLFVTAIITKLCFEVFLEGDVIIQEGTMGTEMYFLREGSVEIRVKNSCQTVLYDGSYFGEICLLTNARRVASVIATTICDTFVLSASDFHEVLEEFPCVRAKIERVAEERLNDIRARQSAELPNAVGQLWGHNASRVDRAVQHPEV